MNPSSLKKLEGFSHFLLHEIKTHHIIQVTLKRSYAMSHNVTVKSGSPVMNQHTGNTDVATVSGMVVMPKLRADGTVKITSIDPYAIIGMEDTTIAYKGQKFNGTKIYTKTGMFKVFAPVSAILLAQGQAKVSALPQAVNASTSIPAYSSAVKGMLPSSTK